MLGPAASPGVEATRGSAAPADRVAALGPVVAPGGPGAGRTPDVDLWHHGDADLEPGVPGQLDLAVNVRLRRPPEWLRARLHGAVEDYARGIKIDTEALRDAMPQIDPLNPESLNPEALNEALSGAAMFSPADTPEQKAALARLETLLALVEGWVATVVATAANNRLPQADALAEAIRRRRATGGPAERTFATLVGLELRPRRLREAATIWQGLTDAHGAAGRDELWRHPDLLPTADDLDDPSAFLRGTPELDISDLTDNPAEPDPDPGEPEA